MGPDLDLPPDALEFHREHGVIQWQDQRVLLVNAETVGAIRRALLDTLGLDGARRLLLRAGFVSGYRDAVSSRAQAGWNDPLDGLAAGSAMQGFAGLAHAELVRVNYDVTSGWFDAEVWWQQSYEVEQHLRQCGAATDTVCWTLCGYASGYASACLGRVIEFRETECAAVAGTKCIAIGRDAARWCGHDDGRGSGNDYAALMAELEQPGAAGPGDRAVSARREQIAAHQAVDDLRERVAEYARLHDIILVSEEMKEAFELAARVAPLDTSVLITGESGTGKELLVRMIHCQSRRATHPLVNVNCAAITETLLESELFGHVRGAFTDAVRDKAGLFEVARLGTLLLDEVAEMAPALQAKLLRALQEGEIRRVGGETSIQAKPRIIAATNRDIRAAVQSGAFREDLYYRLASFVIAVPPLRERREAIPHMARYYLRQTAARLEKDVRTVAPDAMRILVDYPWPGNVRELQHAIERAVILAPGHRITARELPPDLRRPYGDVLAGTSYDLERRERDVIEQALARFGGNRRRAAAALHISTVTLWRRMTRYGLQPSRSDES